MAARRFRCASAFALGAFALAADAVEPLRDAPVLWHADEFRHLSEAPAERQPSVEWDYFNDAVAAPIQRFFDPTLSVRRIGRWFGGAGAPPAQNVNALDEVPNGAWFENRIGLFDLAPDALRKGPRGDGPDGSAPWTVVRAKTEGVTPGFTIRDRRGDLFLIKFDPPGYPSASTAGGVISQRILHAAGYHVPDDNIVHFRPEELSLAEGVSIREVNGKERTMTLTDVRALLEHVPRRDDGRIRAIASRFLPGRPLGPFAYESRRPDDANDRIRHEHRRELRGLAVFAAWIHHFDTKQSNTLDMLIESDKARYVRHYLIDFASTLGTGASGPAPRFGWEYTLDPKAVVRRTLQLGLGEDDWRRVRRDPSLPELGYFDVEHFDPRGYAPLQSNPAFVLLTPRDGYWAAKIISAFRDEHLQAFVAEAQYEHPRAAEAMVAILAGRRDRLVRSWFDQMPPLDFFRSHDGQLIAQDLGRLRGYYDEPTRYRVRWRSVDAQREGDDWTPWQDASDLSVDLGTPSFPGAFRLVQWQLDRGRGWSKTVEVAVAASDRIVEVRR
jgi:hypothetical protein